MNQIAMAGVNQPARSKRRNTRPPTIKFAQTVTPFDMKFLWAHPVMPGESLKNMQSTLTCVQSKVANDQTGWWLNQYAFYVPLRSMTHNNWFKTEIEPALLDPNGSEMTGLANEYNHGRGRFVGGFDVMTKCMTTIRNAFFRYADEMDEAFNSIFKVKYNHKTVLDSVLTGTVPNYDFNLDLNADGTLMASELQEAWVRYEQVQRMGLTKLTWDEWLAQYGIGTQQSEIPEPEILRFTKNWALPVRIIDPTSGDPVSYFKWNLDMNSGTRKYFREPGFIIHTVCAVPQMYILNHRGSAGMLTRGVDWMPPEVWDQPFATYREYDSTTTENGPLRFGTGAGTSYSIDSRDMLWHGDQFLGDASAMVPTATVTLADKDYVPAEDLNSLFVGGLAVEPGLVTGSTKLEILGHVKDLTQTTIGSSQAVQLPSPPGGQEGEE